jgi:hypothetical protein
VCALEFRPTAPSNTSAAYFHVAEVELYDLQNRLIPSSSLGFSLSSTWSSSLAVANCFDGNLATVCSTADGANNTVNPTLRVTYSCPSGATSLARVVVQNRRDTAQDKISRFSLNFLSSLGTSDTPPYVFNGANLTYIIPVACGSPVAWSCSSHLLYISPHGSTWQQFTHAETFALNPVPASDTQCRVAPRPTPGTTVDPSSLAARPMGSLHIRQRASLRLDAQLHAQQRRRARRTFTRGLNAGGGLHCCFPDAYLQRLTIHRLCFALADIFADVCQTHNVQARLEQCCGLHLGVLHK